MTHDCTQTQRRHTVTTSKATEGGKGSRKRTRQVSRETYSENYDRIYPETPPYDQIISLIDGMRKKGLTDEAIETEVMKEYGQRVTVGEVRELLI